MLDGYEPSSVLRLRRFDGYWERDAQGEALPYLDGIDFVITPDAAAMDAAFRTGRLDGGARGEGHYLTIERQRGYERDLGGDVWYGHMQGGLFRLAFNVLKEGPWQDVRVRQAISLWIDREAAIPGVLGGFGYVSPILGLTNPFTGSDFVTWPRFSSGALDERRAEAKGLMAEAGFAGGFSMNYLVPRPPGDAVRVPPGPARRSRRRPRAARGRRGRVEPGARQPRIRQPARRCTSPRPSPRAPSPSSAATRRTPTPTASTTTGSWTTFTTGCARPGILTSGCGCGASSSATSSASRPTWCPSPGSVQVVPYRAYARGVIIPPEDGHTHTDFATVWLDR